MDGMLVMDRVLVMDGVVVMDGVLIIDGVLVMDGVLVIGDFPIEIVCVLYFLPILALLLFPHHVLLKF
jgi:acetyltransferase-like isoleucine patch superfamily enzyme